VTHVHRMSSLLQNSEHWRNTISAINTTVMPISHQFASCLLPKNLQLSTSSPQSTMSLSAACPELPLSLPNDPAQSSIASHAMISPCATSAASLQTISLSSACPELPLPLPNNHASQHTDAMISPCATSAASIQTISLSSACPELPLLLPNDPASQHADAMISPNATSVASLQIKTELLQENLLPNFNFGSNLQLSTDGIEIMDQTDTSINLDLVDSNLLAFLIQTIDEAALVDDTIHDTLSGTAGIDPRLLSLTQPSTSSPTATHPLPPFLLPHSFTTAHPSSSFIVAENPSSPSSCNSNTPQKTYITPSNSLSSDNSNDPEQNTHGTHNKDELGNNDLNADGITCDEGEPFKVTFSIG
jgi:hypothetical protein